jgi:methyl-accepting chemotaxis protein
MALPYGRNGPSLGGTAVHSSAVTQPDRLVSSLLKSRLVLVFLVLVCVVVAINIKFLWDVSAQMPAQPETTVYQSAEHGTASAGEVGLLRNFRNQLFILVGVTIVCFSAMLYLLVSRVIMPLANLVQAVGEISKGDLSLTLLNHGSNELGELRSVVTGVMTDFQEVVLLTGATVGNSVSTVERIEEMLQLGSPASQDDLKLQVGSIKSDLETLRTMVNRFQFYHARFDGRKVVPQGPGTEN